MDLLGFSNLDLVQELLANRQAIVEGAQSSLLSSGKAGLGDGLEVASS